MFNVEYCKLHERGTLKFFRGMLLNGHPGGFVFFSGGLSEKGAQFFLGDVTSVETGMIVILLSFLYNYDNLTLKLHQGKRSYIDEGWLFICRFKVGSVPGIRVEASKKYQNPS